MWTGRRDEEQEKIKDRRRGDYLRRVYGSNNNNSRCWGRIYVDVAKLGREQVASCSGRETLKGQLNDCLVAPRIQYMDHLNDETQIKVSK